MSLENVKVGDEVLGSYNHNEAIYQKFRVDRVTPTQIVVGSNRYRKSDGKRVSGYSSFDRITLLDTAGQALLAAYEAEQRRRVLVGRLAKFNWSSLSIEQAREVDALLKSFGVGY